MGTVRPFRVRLLTNNIPIKMFFSLSLGQLVPKFHTHFNIVHSLIKMRERFGHYLSRTPREENILMGMLFVKSRTQNGRTVPKFLFYLKKKR